MEENKLKQDIFLEASMQSFQPSVKSTKTRTITLQEQDVVESVSAEIIEVDKHGLPIKKTEWNKLKKDLDGTYAKKFNKILNDLPDREFVRVYLKVLEFTKPKIIRESGKSEAKQDTTINIQINRTNEKTD